ncbi:MAG: lysophospholipid transporter LplT [Rhodobacteraceae bacterium]|nr:lysophospholipid transporter LplT [Paracoccaceae bacterium]|tara:strand:+ start:2277 stop:3467 length:1191 start_codon:yes stop_codon:yes gene_type:complete
MQVKSYNQIRSKGFYSFLSAQFLSALADNALLFAAIALLTRLDAPTWHQPLLLQFFVFAYIVLAPFVGAYADSKPKGQVMFIANGIKLFGCLAMFFGLQPLYAYGIVGIGAAAYSPAKYGILTEMLPANSLVSANGWVEGSTVAAIILGAMFGGILAVYNVDLAIVIISLLYLIAAIFNRYIPSLPLNHKIDKKDPWSLIKDFLSSFKKLWNDPLGQLSLTITTLFWGAGATLRLVIIAWAAYALGFGLDKSTTLSATVAFGVAIGAIIAAFFIKMKDSTKILPIGIFMGFVVCSIFFVTTWETAAIILTIVGVLSGLLIVPLNALLQYRGHLLVGAGHSIAVQNFSENLGILLLSGAYTFMVKGNIPINGIMFIFGFFVLLSMTIASIYYAKAND